MEKLLMFLDGKKAVIGGVLNAINAYLTATGIITPELGALVSTVIMVLTGVAVQQSNKLLGNAYRSRRY